MLCFYLSNEGLSLLENATHLGLPVPDKLKDVLAQLHGRQDVETETDKETDKETEKDKETDKDKEKDNN